MNSLIKLTAALMLLVPLLVSASEHGGIVEYEIEYVMKLGGMKVGKTTGKLRKIGDNHYESTSEYKPGMMLKVTGERKSIQTSTVRVDESGNVQSEKFIIEYKKKDSIGAEYDWNARTFTRLDGETLPMPDHTIYVWAAWYMRLMQGNYEDFPGKRITIAGKEGEIEYEIGNLEKAVVEVGSATHNAIKFSMHQVQNEKEIFTFWASPDHNNFPVKMQRLSKGAKVIIETKSIKFKK